MVPCFSNYVPGKPGLAARGQACSAFDRAPDARDPRADDQLLLKFADISVLRL